MHYRGILLCNTCPGSIYEHEVYYKITQTLYIRSYVVVCFCKNGFTILNVEYSERSLPV